MHRSQGRDHFSHLDEFFDRGLIEEVLGLIKAGKEATVYCCRAGRALDASLVAAKVYRAQQYRFKNDAVYQESRARELGLRGRALRAFEKRRSSNMGRKVQSGIWQHREYDVMQTLYEAGADVPQPIAAAEDAILMEYFGDEEEAAQMLNRVRLDPEEAPGLFQRVMNNVELMLALNLVHGDLSPHNMLYFEGDLRIIDFPQTSDARFNSHSYELLARDIENICRYFGASGVEAEPRELVDELWRRFTFSEL